MVRKNVNFITFVDSNDLYKCYTGWPRKNATLTITITLDDDAGNPQPTRRPVTVTQQAVVYSNFQNYGINDGYFPLTDRCGNFGGAMHSSHVTHGSGAVAQHTVNGAHPALVNYPISQQGIQPPHSNYGCIVQTTF